MKFKLMFILPLLSFACNQDPEILQQENNALRVYPNPADVQVFVSINNRGGSAFALSVFGTQGETLLEVHESMAEAQYVVDLTDKPKGTYEVALKMDGETFTRKIFKR